jgi:hypothetical protein
MTSAPNTLPLARQLGFLVIGVDLVAADLAHPSQACHLRRSGLVRKSRIRYGCLT